MTSFTIVNKVNNLMYRYGIKEIDSNPEEIEKVVEKKDFYIYIKICDVTDNVRIVEVTNKWFIAEIDIEENNYLIKDLNRKFFINRIHQRSWAWLGMVL